MGDAWHSTATYGEARKQPGHGKNPGKIQKMSQLGRLCSPVILRLISKPRYRLPLTSIFLPLLLFTLFLNLLDYLRIVFLEITARVSGLIPAAATFCSQCCLSFQHIYMGKKRANLGELSSFRVALCLVKSKAVMGD